MHTPRTKNNSVTPLRQPFETFVSENTDAYKSIARWRSKFYSSNDDEYLSPSFLDDTCSLSSSPLFQDDTPSALLSSSSISPNGLENVKMRNRTLRDSAFSDSNENTPLNNRFIRKFSSTPVFTSPAKTAVHDEEGFLIPDLPGSSKRVARYINNSGDSTNDLCNRNSTEPVHITMPPRLGFPSQTPLNIRDQYEKSPLPVVTANLDYRTVYMGDKLATRARDLRNRYEISPSKISVFQENRFFNVKTQNSDFYSEDPLLEDEDYVLHRGELLRSRYLKHSKIPADNNYYKSDIRSRSLSSYYKGSLSRNNQISGYRSSSLATKNFYRTSIGDTHLYKKRRMGSYIANNDDLLQQHIQLIDKSLERCHKDVESVEFGDFELESNNEYSEVFSLKRNSGKSLTSSSPNNKYTQIQSNENDPADFSSDLISSENMESCFKNTEEVSSNVKKNANSLKISSSKRANLLCSDLSPIEKFKDSSPLINLKHSSKETRETTENQMNASNCLTASQEVPLSHSQENLQSPKSFSSLDEIIPHPIPCSLDSNNFDSSKDNVVYENELFSNQKNNRDSKSYLFKKSKNYQTGDQIKKKRVKNFNRKRHIDYHIPINQVKPLETTSQINLSESRSVTENNTRRYPKRLRTAPLKWYLGERLEYQRDEKNELGYTIAAIHKVANPKMLPNERGSIYPNEDSRNSVISHTVEISQDRDKSSNINESDLNGCDSEGKSFKEQIRKKGHISKKNFRRKKNEGKRKLEETAGKDLLDRSNAVILKNEDTNENFSMVAVFDRSSLCWADVEYAPGKPYNVALSFISSQATCCEICLPPLTEKGLDESQDNYILGHVYMAPDNNSLQIMISDDNIYNIGVGDWFLIPDNTNYNFSNTSSESEVYISLYVIKDS